MFDPRFPRTNCPSLDKGDQSRTSSLDEATTITRRKENGRQSTSFCDFVIPPRGARQPSSGRLTSHQVLRAIDRHAPGLPATASKVRGDAGRSAHGNQTSSLLFRNAFFAPLRSSTTTTSRRRVRCILLTIADASPPVWMILKALANVPRRPEHGEQSSARQASSEAAQADLRPSVRPQVRSRRASMDGTFAFMYPGCCCSRRADSEPAELAGQPAGRWPIRRRQEVNSPDGSRPQTRCDAQTDVTGFLRSMLSRCDPPRTLRR